MLEQGCAGLVAWAVRAGLAASAHCLGPAAAELSQLAAPDDANPGRPTAATGHRASMLSRWGPGEKSTEKRPTGGPSQQWRAMNGSQHPLALKPQSGCRWPGPEWWPMPLCYPLLHSEWHAINDHAMTTAATTLAMNIIALIPEECSTSAVASACCACALGRHVLADNRM